MRSRWDGYEIAAVTLASALSFAIVAVTITAVIARLSW